MTLLSDNKSQRVTHIIIKAAIHSYRVIICIFIVNNTNETHSGDITSLKQLPLFITHKIKHYFMDKLKSLIESRSCSLWLLLICGCLVFEVFALYYQYVLDYPPCVVCIHVRILLAALLLTAIFGLFLRRHLIARISALALILTVCASLIERSWLLLGTERGFIMGSCSFDLGLPSWLALDQWAPLIFKVHTTCGYTPIIALGFSMAEILLVLFSLMSVFILWLLYTEFAVAAKENH